MCKVTLRWQCVRDKDVLLLTGNPAHPFQHHIMASDEKLDLHQHLLQQSVSEGFMLCESQNTFLYQHALCGQVNTEDCVM